MQMVKAGSMNVARRISCNGLKPLLIPISDSQEKWSSSFHGGAWNTHKIKSIDSVSGHCTYWHKHSWNGRAITIDHAFEALFVKCGLERKCRTRCHLAKSVTPACLGGLFSRYFIRRFILANPLMDWPRVCNYQHKALFSTQTTKVERTYANNNN